MCTHTRIVEVVAKAQHKVYLQLGGNCSHSCCCCDLAGKRIGRIVLASPIANRKKIERSLKRVSRE